MQQLQKLIHLFFVLEDPETKAMASVDTPLVNSLPAVRQGFYALMKPTFVNMNSGGTTGIYAASHKALKILNSRSTSRGPKRGLYHP